MATAYFMLIVSVEHDGNCTPGELVKALGAGIDMMQINMNIITADDIQGHIQITECLGVDKLLEEQLEGLLDRKGS